MSRMGPSRPALKESGPGCPFGLKWPFVAVSAVNGGNRHKRRQAAPLWRQCAGRWRQLALGGGANRRWVVKQNTPKYAHYLFRRGVHTSLV
eukprot:COSAG02_NODE_273_length_26316_cov_13.661060_10_plen_91_part_00